MKIIVYSDSNEKNIKKKFGTAEYSYYFVLREFLPLLRECGDVTVITDPRTDIDAIYQSAQRDGEACLFLSFMPPHKTYIHPHCPTIPVLAWEFNNIPCESWDNEPQNDWRLVLGRCGAAITHSSHSVKTIRQDVRADFPVIAIPSPVWDRFCPTSKKPKTTGVQSNFALTISGTVLDSNQIDFRENLTGNISHYNVDNYEVTLSGVIYTSVFNPLDGRKNWIDMVTAFCWAHKDHSNATLVLKLTCNHNRDWPEMLTEAFQKSPLINSRVVVIRGYLENDSYDNLSRNTSFSVNTSKGEGQCLPLMEYLSAGTPGISPDHTGMADYITPENSFVVESSLEPVAWPDDTRKAYRTTQFRLNWESLYNCYIQSYRVATSSPGEYQRMSECALFTLEQHCSVKIAQEKLLRLFTFLQELHCKSLQL